MTKREDVERDLHLSRRKDVLRGGEGERGTSDGESKVTGRGSGPVSEASAGIGLAAGRSKEFGVSRGGDVDEGRPSVDDGTVRASDGGAGVGEGGDGDSPVAA